ncbi:MULTISPECIES: flagellar biosynthetic protein FliO [Providencia]|uniref:flagellar biosynthetic protein FliO n=1 Tax=Providencia TaxID=586 RepID=UPI00111D9B1F|nr:flagellar biosynthetic protein FliO [Providencia stuartii]ELR5039177.1 flagellar biosynthetic protein FliO [Providencia stuartii]ELR5083201.1 flagellar biosynthetic protein FliO [Providencia stuartii]
MKTTPFISQTEQPSGQAIPALSNSHSLMQISGALGGIILLILAGSWLVKKLGLAPKQLGKSQLLKVKSSCSLGNKERVVVVEMNNEWLVLGVTAQSVNLLHQCPAVNRKPLTSVPEPLTFQSVFKKKQDAVEQVASKITNYQ